MRLSPGNQSIIKQTAREIFGDVRVLLFGSRVQDNLKGGDIDLLSKYPPAKPGALIL
ncbi:nucleotidyltransferase domain-containing protein [Thiolapillus sp.]